MAGRSGNRRSSTRSTFALAAWWLLAVPAAGATTIEVTHLQDDTSTTNGTCTLREAIRAANGNVAVDACPAGQSSFRDEIIVKVGVHQVSLTSGAGEDSAVTGDLDVRAPVRIRGASARYSIIQGSAVGAVDRLFQVHDIADDVSFESVALRGGNATDGTKRGGVLWNLETGPNEVDLVEVEISGGLADSGGGIFNEGDLIIQRSRIADNRTTVLAAAGNHGGGIASTGVSASLRIEDTAIVANRADEDGAGAWIGSGTFVADRSQMNDNIAGGNGGGLAIATNGYELQYDEFARNQAAVGGGVHLTDQGQIQRSAFIANQASVRGGGLSDIGSTAVRFSTFTQNASPLGAGIYADSNQTLLDSDTIASNVGGGVHNQRGAFLENNLLSLNTGGNCTGTPPAFGAFNLDHAATCGFGPTPTGPNFPNTNPLLGPLADNGGPTRTMALLAGSPAIDVVSSEIRTNCQNMFDQRGHPRGRPHTVNASNEDVFHCDIGAYEVTPAFLVDSRADIVDANLADDRCATATGLCTLRAAIQQANAIPGRNEIVLGSGVYALSLAGTGEDAAVSGDLDIVPPLSIQGLGAAFTTVDGAGLDRVFEILTPPPGTALPGIAPSSPRSLLRDFTITGGDAGANNGGGIALRSPLRIERVRLTDNDGNRGSAISSSPTGFSFSNPVPVEIVNSTVDHNPGAGALFLSDAVVERSSLIENVADIGVNGGAGEFLRVRLENSTVAGNFASSTGAFFAQSALIESSTIYGNSANAGFDPGGIFVLDLSVMRNSIIAHNRAGATLHNCSMNPGAITSLGHNLTDGNAVECLLNHATDQIATEPLLAALANNGGPTLTHLPLAGSLAIDRGDPAVCPTTDQRDAARPADGDANGSMICDIGAVEVPEPALVVQLLVGGIALAIGERARRRASAS